MIYMTTTVEKLKKFCIEHVSLKIKTGQRLNQVLKKKQKPFLEI